MKFLFFAMLLFLGLTAYGQTTITLTEDLVLSETLVIEEATTYEGNGFSIICEGCNPAILVRKDIRVHFENVWFKRSFDSWLRVEGGQMSNVTWNSPLMRGSLKITSPND